MVCGRYATAVLRGPTHGYCGKFQYWSRPAYGGGHRGECPRVRLGLDYAGNDRRTSCSGWLRFLTVEQNAHSRNDERSSLSRT
jgi:hypothetical protein